MPGDHSQRRYSDLEIDVDQDVMRCVADAQGRVVFVSPALGRALGVTPSALVTRPVLDMLNIVSSLDQNAATLDIAGILPGFYEVALYRQSRDPLLVQARIDVVKMPDGRAYTVFWFDPDNKLTRQKEENFDQVAREFTAFVVKNRDACEPVKPTLISREDSELRHFLNMTTDLIGVYTQDVVFVRVNTAFNRVLGFSDNELRQFPFLDLVHPDDRDYVERLMQEVMHSPPEREVRIDFECRSRCKDGGFRWIHWLQKAVGGYIYIVGQDITHIKQHEAELERREQQLSEAQKIGRMGHWYWVVDQDSMEWSDQIFTIFGVEKDSFSPTLDSINRLLLKRDFSRLYKGFQRALVTREDYDLEFRLRRPNGGIRYIRCEGRCKVDEKTGRVEALYGIMQDITERTLHERALREAKEAAESAYASKTRFLANMSHELRTPLNAIIGFSEMMQRQLLGPIGNDRYLDYIGGIRESGEHLLALINDILDMSKIEIGKYELYTEEINVGKLIRLGLHMMEGRAHESQVRLEANEIPDDIHITADRRALMQILLNLMSNALKFTQAGGTVEIRLMRELGGVAIIVRDTGVGIPKDKLEVVTLPFEQASGELTRNHEGSGLGLAITKDLIDLHGGTLDIESEVGVGTTVTVLLPEKIPERKMPVATTGTDDIAEHMKQEEELV